MLETIQAVAAFYPFSFTDTLALIPSVILFFQYLIKGQWDKLGNQAKFVGLEMYEKIATDTEKRQAVLSKVEQSIPVLLKPLMNKESLDKMINTVYLTEVKPAAIEAGLIKGTPPEEPKEENRIQELANDMLGAAAGKLVEAIPEFTLDLIR